MNTRRHFLSQSALVTAAAFLPSLRAGAAGAPTNPSIEFPTKPRQRLAVASYPFRDYILPAVYTSPSAASATPKMELVEFAAHVKSRFKVNKIEPWSSHFRSLDPSYLEGFRAALTRAGSEVANIAFDGEHSFYALDAEERKRAVADNKKWIDAAIALGCPSIRTHVAISNNEAPDIERAADTLSRIVEYAATRNIVIHLENDDGVSEDPIFLVRLIDRVNSLWLRALPDFGNSLMHKAPTDAYAGFEAMCGSAYGICHVKQSESTEKGANVAVDLPYAFGILNKSNFRGYLSMEYDNTGDPYQGTDELIAKALQLLA
jgi:sugar phosphate isomerase/epimerase